MKLPTSIALAAIALAVVVWAVFAFVIWDWNPSNWSEDSRTLAAIAWVAFIPVALGAAVQYVTENKQ